MSPEESAALARDLAKIVGEEGVSTKMVDRLATCRDFWPLMGVWFVEGKVPALPDVIVWPKSTAEVAAVLSLANERGIPVTPFGKGSGVLGGAIPLRGGIVLDTKLMKRVKELDRENLMITVEPGLNGALYEEYLNRHGFTGGHFPQSVRCSSVGGWLACRAAGQLSNRYGKIEDIVVALEAVLPDGTVIRGPKKPRTSTGPRIDLLFLGSEGTLGVITEATLSIWPYPEQKAKLSYAFDSLEQGLTVIRKIMQAGGRPAVVRLYDLDETAGHFPETREAEGRCMLVLLIEGDSTLVSAEVKLAQELALEEKGLDCGEAPVDHWDERRYNVSLSSKMIRQGAVLDTIEVTANWDNAFTVYKNMREALLNVEGTALASGHYSHVYPEGACLYMTICGFAPGDKTEYYKRFWSAAMEACLASGASIGHHHGLGLHRGLWMEEEQGENLKILRRIKQALDPKGIMNPGKLSLEVAEKWQK